MDTLIQWQKTDTNGVVTFYFDKWKNGMPVDTTNISRIDIEFPNTYKVIRIGEEIQFEPLKFELVEFKGRVEGIEIVLPMTVYTKIDTVGVGPYLYVFAIMTDLHIAEGKKKQRHIVEGDTLWLSDFGTPGFNDTDNDPNETTFAIENNKNIVAMINWWKNNWGLPLKFIVCLGDITSTSERSEYQRTLKVLQELDLPYIPILGNHDTWPYIGQWSY
ncbi:MAG: metallophosphoesterase family protein [bacterium]